jgi:SpoVK/Ycf46/Vps4 family AAA+-type ATPase
LQTVDVIEDLKILEHFPFKMNELYKNPFPNSNSIIKFLIKNSVTPERNLNMFISGRPGTGKTTYVRYLSKKSGLPIYQVKASNLVSSFIGDTQRNIDLLLKDINKVGSKGIVLIDELDSIFGNRKSTINDEYKRIIGSFNLMLDSLGTWYCNDCDYQS